MLPPIPPGFWIARFARIFIAALLLSAAVVKAYGVFTGTAEPMPLFPSLRAQMLVIEAEGLLGFWLLSGRYLSLARYVALLFFTGLAAVSFSLGLEGESSCGCFGRIQVNPWLTFAVDMVAIAALAFLQRPRDPASDSRLPRRALMILAGSSGLLALMIGGFLLTSSDPWSTLAEWRGESLAVEPAISEVGTGIPGDSRDVVVRLVNRTAHPVHWIGGTTTCACVATDDLPLTLSPGESRAIQVRIRFKGSKGRFRHRFLLYTDDDDQQVVVARLSGRVEEAPE